MDSIPFSAPPSVISPLSTLTKLKISCSLSESHIPVNCSVQSGFLVRPIEILRDRYVKGCSGACSGFYPCPAAMFFCYFPYNGETQTRAVHTPGSVTALKQSEHILGIFIFYPNAVVLDRQDMKVRCFFIPDFDRAELVSTVFQGASEMIVIPVKDRKLHSHVWLDLWIPVRSMQE